MDILFSLIDGILIALQPMNLGLAILGVVVGLFVGAMPGLGSVNGVAILLPFTFVIQSMSGGATSPMIFLAAVYYGAMYGGAISSVALGIPGASTAVATTFDGRPLALQGRAYRPYGGAAGLIARGDCLQHHVHRFRADAGVGGAEFRQPGDFRADAAGVRHVCRAWRR